MARTSQTKPPVQGHMKQRILDAAARLFAEKGFDGTSISDIVKAAPAGRALIYYYFEDKRALHQAALLDGAERISQVASEAYASEGSSLDRLRRFITDFRQLHIDRTYIARLAMRAEFEDRMSPGSIARDPVNIAFDSLSRIVQEGIESGEFRSVDPRRVTHSVLGLVHSLTVMSMLDPGISDPAEDVDFVVGLIGQGIAARPE